jgi:FAD/FMN-containing dehydrogenase
MTVSRYEWGRTHPKILELEAATADARNKVITHPMYASLDNHAAIVTFMEHHVFAVWDFMSLLKSLQRSLTCVDVPWVPSGPTGSRRLINDIVLVEESDERGSGFISHFELYIEGMAEAGADTSAIASFLEYVSSGKPVGQALDLAKVLVPSAEFVRTTWSFIHGTKVHQQAAAFAFGREDLIPDMFTQVVEVKEQGAKLDTFVDYLVRHIQVDGEEHTPMAMQMLADLCGDDEDKWRECAETVNLALNARQRFWDGILASISASE